MDMPTGERGGERCNVIQIVPERDAFSVRLMTDMSEVFAKGRADYVPRTERLGIDFGLSTLIASDRGDLMGRGFLDAMTRLDRQLVEIARHLPRSGGRPRDSQRYCALVKRVRGIHAHQRALNRLVEIHAPREIVVERLDSACRACPGGSTASSATAAVVCSGRSSPI